MTRDYIFFCGNKSCEKRVKYKEYTFNIKQIIEKHENRDMEWTLIDEELEFSKLNNIENIERYQIEIEYNLKSALLKEQIIMQVMLLYQ
jgi:hypothetical protein